MKISICGLGNMGKNHLRICKKMGFDIISIYDPINEQDYGEFLKSLRVCDSLIISNPTKYHTKTILDAIENNSKLKILCEKPISFSSKDDNLQQILSFKNSILVGMIERFNPVVQKINSIFEQNKFELIQIKTKRVNNVPSRENIDCRKDIGIHDIDFSCYIMKHYPEEIKIMSAFNNHHENMFYNIKNTHVINEVSWLYPFKDRSFEIVTTDGVFVGHFYKQELSLFDWSGQEIKYNINKTEPLINEILFLKKMCEQNIDSISTVEENIKLLELMNY